MDETERDRLLRIFAETRVIAVVGASGNAAKPSFRVPRYLQAQGYRIRPVNPYRGVILGEPVAASLAEVEPIDVVEVFRPAAEAPAIARQAIAAGARVLWLQSGITSEEARGLAGEAGLTVVMDRCMSATHAELGLGHVR